MAVFVRSRLPPPLFNEKVRNRISGFGFSSISNSTTTTSGSEHDGDSDAVSSPSSTSSSAFSQSPCLSFLVHSFLEDDAVAEDQEEASIDESESRYLLESDTTALVRDLIEPTAWSNADRFRTDLLAYVNRAADAFSLFRPNKSAFNRNVMAYLRQIGYDAGVCKTKWEATPGGNLAAGNHEFIDVIPDPNSRYVIDLDFTVQFEIARATDSYMWLIRSLPRVFVGNSSDLKRIVKLMADEARKSIKINGLNLPPWRKNRYMQLKWFGPYRRTVNQFQSSAASSPLTSVESAANRRSVGFDLLEIAPPAATRTRTRH